MKVTGIFDPNGNEFYDRCVVRSQFDTYGILHPCKNEEEHLRWVVRYSMDFKYLHFEKEKSYVFIPSNYKVFDKNYDLISSSDFEGYHYAVCHDPKFTLSSNPKALHPTWAVVDCKVPSYICPHGLFWDLTYAIHFIKSIV